MEVPTVKSQTISRADKIERQAGRFEGLIGDLESVTDDLGVNLLGEKVEETGEKKSTNPCNGLLEKVVWLLEINNERIEIVLCELTKCRDETRISNDEKDY